MVTSLNLKLYGVREDRATGRGSAIIALPDGRQLSFAVGEEIMPGVTLTAVGFDNVTISRGGTAEQIFLDQSPPAQTVGAPETDRARAGRRPRRAVAGAGPADQFPAAHRRAARSTASSSPRAATAARRSARPASRRAT